MIVPVLARLALNVLDVLGDRRQSCANWPRRPQAHDAWIVPCAKDLKANAGKSLVLAGYRLPLAAHLLVMAMNEALGAVNHTVEFHQTQAVQGRHDWRTGGRAQRRAGADAGHPGRQSRLQRAGGFELAASAGQGEDRHPPRLLRGRNFVERGDARRHAMGLADGAFSGIVGRRADGGRNAGSDPAVDRAAVWRNHGIGSAGGDRRPDAEQPLRNCPRNLPRHRRRRRG